MKVRTLDGGYTSWNLGDYVGKQRLDCSAVHEQTREFLKNQYPATQVLEEVYIPGERLFLDFFIPSFKLAIECQGVQHGKYVPFFHGTKLEFAKAMQRDSRKLSWCSLNGIRLEYFFPEEDEDKWKQKIKR